MNEIILTVTVGPRYSYATWWWRHDQWKCVGATSKLSKAVPGMSPEAALNWCRSKGMDGYLTSRHNPNNPVTPPTR